MSDPVKLAIIYYSSTGTGTAIVDEMSKAAQNAGAEVRVRKAAELAPQAAIDANPIWAAHHTNTADVPAPTLDDVSWADALIFGSPTRFGNLAAQLKQFLDTLSPLWMSGALADKVYSGFTSTGTRHGGHESTLLAMNNSFIHFGGIIVPPGYTDPVKFVDGNPYGTSHHADFGPNLGSISEDTRNAARHQAERVIRIAGALKRGFAA
ncbi:NAD(P)H:quinone oxidoreductase [Actinoplanes sp. TRM 88003]|uniref:NAD(P)H:quinone oxidoreductase n=1 Tax=Paractinoplanes aksuensis TaxID=2939490 RepID=A0ABT1E132_9ACTN|nr:NAD(P)H:quinone oxidoreductase [Actinoplanes aksuensis]MCO8275546.1 NAD(P)H:quinone oxidoreductase [Actinoplanes aksuensis]